ncbi:YopX family protein [Streptococcus sp. SO4]|uniref:YopX family protein n=1 Tax=Streptococcus sp. SO4 TaxID=3018249 RepID=UPI00263C11BF|nr:YopX family protein [Streptococcus sp. SO4]MDN5025097.1 YopX family protein [Streptococcus sp. SO4]
MIPKFRAWKKAGKELGRVGQITFELDGSVSHVLFKGEFLDFNVSINEIILMQSTGLHDKNGKEIFEGDIVDYKGRKALVSWHGSYASFIYRFVDELQKRNAEWNPLYLAYMRCEIIGNIYENPELWEVNG